MKLLCVDTSGPVAGAAVLDNGTLAAEVTLNCGLTHSQTIMPAIEYVLDSASVSAKEIDLFAAVTGPGSFTGVRIGVCAVKALARAAGKPCVAVDSLEALAANAAPFEGVAATILDARRQQVYCAAFRPNAAGRPERLMPDDVIPIDAFFAQLPETEKLYFTGDGLAVYEEKIRKTFGDRAVIAPAHMRGIRAGAAAVIAMESADSAMDPNDLHPMYLRAPQAERERNARLKAEKTDE